MAASRPRSSRCGSGGTIRWSEAGSFCRGSGSSTSARCSGCCPRARSRSTNFRGWWCASSPCPRRLLPHPRDRDGGRRGQVVASPILTRTDGGESSRRLATSWGSARSVVASRSCRAHAGAHRWRLESVWIRPVPPPTHRIEFRSRHQPGPAADRPVVRTPRCGSRSRRRGTRTDSPGRCRMPCSRAALPAEHPVVLTRSLTARERRRGIARPPRKASTIKACILASQRSHGR